jgi:hypothetical protein
MNACSYIVYTKELENWRATMNNTKTQFMFTEYFVTRESGSLKFSGNVVFEFWFCLSPFFFLTKKHSCNNHQSKNTFTVGKYYLIIGYTIYYNYLLSNSWMMSTIWNGSGYYWIMRDLVLKFACKITYVTHVNRHINQI